MLPDTQSRVPSHTAAHIGARIESDAIANLARAIRASAVDEQALDERLAQLDREWDTERTLQTNFAIVALLGLALSLKDRRWLLFSAAASGFMVQHALQGWCPPLALFRRRGVRDAGEIERERFALRSLRERSLTSAATAPGFPAERPDTD